MAYISTADAKTYMGITTANDDTLIGDFITDAVAFVEAYTGMIFDGTSTSTRKFTVGVDTEGRELLFDTPAVSITTVTNKADAGTTEEITSSEYVTLPRNRTPYYGVQILSSANKEWDYQDDPEMGIEVIANWRYSTTPPSDVKLAVKRMVAYLYRQKDSNSDLDRPLLTQDGVTIMPSQLPQDVQRILDHYRLRVLAAA